MLPEGEAKELRSVFQTFGGFVPRLAALYVALFILPGIQMPFFPVWLKAKDVDASLIGIILAVPMVARVLAIPVVAREADRRDAVRDVLILASVASVAGYVLVGLSTSAIAILITYTLTSLFYTPLMPLAETYALKGLAARGRAYGPVRLWGSFAFIFGNLAAGLAADVIPARNLIWLMAAASVLIALAAWKLQPLSVNAPEHGVPDVTRPASLRDPAFVAVFAGASSHSGEPCVVLRLFRAAMARGGVRRHCHCCVVGAGCRGRDRAVCGAGPPAALFLTNNAFDGRRCGRRVALVGNGDRSLRAGAALVAAPACTVFRSYSSWGIDVSCAERTGRAGGDRARISGDSSRPCDGGRHWNFGRAVSGLWQQGLRGDGASGVRWRHLRIRSAPDAA